MINLAGHPDPDPIVKEELFLADIAAVRIEPQGEVRTAFGGALQGITLRRAWTYWIAEGRVPLAVAKELFQHPYGKACRVDGHGGGPAPEDPHLEYFDDTNKRLWLPSESEKKLLVDLREGRLVGHLAEVIREMTQSYRLVETEDERLQLSGLGKRAYVTSYHIDSNAGLKVFAQKLSRLQ